LHKQISIAGMVKCMPNIVVWHTCTHTGVPLARLLGPDTKEE